MSEELWFPEFGLKKNPFAFSDRKIERGPGDHYLPIEIEATKIIDWLLVSKSNGIIYGLNGCGKSSALEYMRDVYCSTPIIIGAKSLAELVSEMLRMALRYKQYFTIDDDVIIKVNDNYAGIIQKHTRMWSDRKTSDGHTIPTKILCKFPGCFRKIKCEFPLLPNMFIQNMAQYLPENEICPFAQWMVLRLFENRKKGDIWFMFDTPDDIVNMQKAQYFKDFVEELIKVSGGTVMLMATPLQFKLLIKTEFFRRWHRREFPKLSIEEMKMVYEERLKGSVSSRIKNQNPISEEGLGYLITVSGHNPRNMLRNASRVLEKMMMEGKKEPADRKYVMKVLGAVNMYANEEEVLDDVIEELDHCGWIKVKAVAKMMEKKGLKVGVKRVGRMLKARGFDFRKTKDAEYRIP